MKTRRSARDANPSLFRDYAAVEFLRITTRVLPKEELSFVSLDSVTRGDFYVVNAHEPEIAGMIANWIRNSRLGPPYNRPGYVKYISSLLAWASKNKNQVVIDGEVWLTVSTAPVFYPSELDYTLATMVF